MGDSERCGRCGHAEGTVLLGQRLPTHVCEGCITGREHRASFEDTIARLELRALDPDTRESHRRLLIEALGYLQTPVIRRALEEWYGC